MEWSKRIRRACRIAAAGAVILFVLPACGAAGIMNVTERAPRPDPAVESGEISNPVEIEANAEAEPIPDDAEDFESPESGFPESGPPEGGGTGGGGPPGISSGEMGVVEDGVRRVGEAGEVEFRFEDGVLNLVGARANEGWDYQLGKQEFREVKVFFLSADAQWEFEAESKPGGVLEVETKHEIPNADPGSYEVGEAGSVTFSERDGGIFLDDYAVAEGWNARVEENDSEDVHLKFDDAGGVEYKFEAEYDDETIEVNVDRKERGRIPSG